MRPYAYDTNKTSRGVEASLGPDDAMINGADGTSDLLRQKPSFATFSVCWLRAIS